MSDTPKPYVTDEQIEIMASPYERSPGATRACITGAKATRHMYEPALANLRRERDQALAHTNVLEQLSGVAPWIGDPEVKNLFLKAVNEARAFLSTLNTPTSDGK